MNFLRYENFPEKGIRYSKAQVWRLRKLPADDPRKFPDPVKGLGPENAWTEPQIDEYVSRQVAAVRDVELKVA